MSHHGDLSQTLKWWNFPLLYKSPHLPTVHRIIMHTFLSRPASLHYSRIYVSFQTYFRLLGFCSSFKASPKYLCLEPLWSLFHPLPHLGPLHRSSCPGFPKDNGPSALGAPTTVGNEPLAGTEKLGGQTLGVEFHREHVKWVLFYFTTGRDQVSEMWVLLRATHPVHCRDRTKTWLCLTFKNWAFFLSLYYIASFFLKMVVIISSFNLKIVL